VLQPTWRNAMHLVPSGAGSQKIEVSYFTVVHTQNPDEAGSYERKALTEVIHAIDDLNAAYFAQDNAVSRDQVRRCCGQRVRNG
jgi:hypothetical protein